MTRDELLPIIEMMKTYGGGFVQSLAETMLRADRDNLKRLVDAFPDMIERYKGFVDKN